MPKITSADCVQAIIQRLSMQNFASLNSLSKDWKRVSKNKTDHGGVLRVFHCKSLPEFEARVTEENGVIAEVILNEINILASENSEKFVYALQEDPNHGGYVFIVLTPQQYWQVEGFASDEHFDIPHDLLPKNKDGSPAGEEMEGTWSVEGKTLQDIDSEMQRLGYIKDINFQNFINGDQPYRY